MENKLLSKEYVVNKLVSAENIYEFADCSAEELITYLQYGCEHYALTDGYGVNETFHENFKDLRRITADKILKLDIVYVLLAQPLMPFCSEDTGEFGITIATSEKSVETIMNEQKEKGRRCYASELDDVRNFLYKSFFIDGYDHVVLWNSDMKAAFLLEDDFFKEEEKEGFEKYCGNNGLASKIASYQQELYTALCGVSVDSEVFLRKEMRAFAALMDAELIVPQKKDGAERETTTEDEFVRLVPQIEFDNAKGGAKLIPVFTDLCAMMHSEFNFEKYSFVRIHLEDILELIPCDYISINPKEIGLIINKEVAEERVAAVKRFVSEFTEEKIIDQICKKQ